MKFSGVTSHSVMLLAYELLCALGERLPRVYLENGIIVSVKDRILPE